MFRFLVVLFVSLAGSAPLAAQPYPSKPIRLVLNVGTGGVVDITNRIYTQYMSRSLDQPNDIARWRKVIEQAKIERQ